MTDYRAPVRDMQFTLHEVLRLQEHYQSIGKHDINRDLMDAILEEGGKFAAEVVAPTNREGDEQGARFEQGRVTTPPGFREAYRQYCENGWASMTGPADYEGQGLPLSLAAPFHEMLMSANLSFRIYSGLTEGAVLALNTHGSDELKSTYLAKLISGEWTGTMCLTEPQAGTDLALLRTRAEPEADGSYRISGTKIFISGGEHDMSDNIIHLVLARLPDAPKGVKGISLFLVPKRLPDADGNPGEANTLSCGSIEHKMGIKGAATCVMNFDDARGWLIGEANQGLACMFTMMNDARYQVGLQGLGVAEMAYQGAVEYALERLQSRALTGAKAPEQPADPIIVHPDVRRMLLTQRSLTEGCRLLAYEVAAWLDTEHFHPDADVRKEASHKVAFYIPIIKGFLTEMSMEVTNLGVQVYGGHGYIREWGMEQLVRDARITQIYEGTNGIQALDLIRRKLLADRGHALQAICSEATARLQDLKHIQGHWRDLVMGKLQEWQTLGQKIMQQAADNPEEIGSAAHDFLYYSSYVLLAEGWLRMASVAGEALAAGSSDRDFYQSKIDTAAFYLQRILPRADAHRHAILSGADNLFAMSAASFRR